MAPSFRNLACWFSSIQPRASNRSARFGSTFQRSPSVNACRRNGKSENGFIAVVTNSLNKAYFLHENDPVFNGYVLKITGDSVVFQETFQDKLGKPLTREIVKKLTTPAV